MTKTGNVNDDHKNSYVDSTTRGGDATAQEVELDAGIKIDFGDKLQLRKDSSTSGRVIFGWATPITLSTGSTWLIYAEDQIGTSFHRQFAEVATVPTADFVHQWSNRDNILPVIEFQNEFSVQFSGAADENASAADSSDLDFINTDEFSIGVWFKTTNGNSELYQKTSTTGGNNGYWLRLNSTGTLEFSFRGTGVGNRIRVRTDGFTIGNDGSWHYVLITKTSGSATASTITIYADGNDETLNILNDTLSGTTTNSSGLFVASNISGGGRFSGNIEEMTVWNAELTALEADEVYNLNNGAIDIQAGSGQISSALVSWWRFGDGSFAAIPTIPDEQGSNDLTLGSAVTSGDIESETPP